MTREGGRKPRSDKKHRFLLRIDPKDWKRLKGLAFNTDLSLNVLVNNLISAALENQEIMSAIQASHPISGDYVLVREEY